MSRQLNIPDKWIAGYLLGHKGATVQDAVAAWMEQEDAEREMRDRIRRRLRTVPPISPYRSTP